MLLKQKRVSTNSQFVKKNQFSREIESQNIRKEPLTGMYVDKDQRLNKKEQIQKANYKLGYQKQEVPKSINQQTLIYGKTKEMEPKQIGPANADKKEKSSNQEMKNAINKARQSNFSIGNGPSAQMQTSSKMAFQDTINDRDIQFDMAQDTNQGKVQNKDIRQINKEAATRPNFNYGHESVQYYTTTKGTYNTQGFEGNVKKTTKQEQIDRVNKARQQQFSYGTHMPKYQSLTKENFGNKSMEGINQTRQERRQNGLETRQAHLLMGTDVPAFGDLKKVKGESPQKSHPKFQIGGKPVNNNQVCNFSTEQTKNKDPNRFLSLNKQAGNCMKIGVGQPYMTKEEKVIQRAAARDFRNAHFDFGADKQTKYETHTQSAMVKHDMPKNRKETLEQQKTKMQKANFELISKGGDIPVETIYHSYMPPQTIQPQKRAPSIGARKSNVTIGELDHKNVYQTEQNRQFGNPRSINRNHGASTTMNVDMKSKLRVNNFAIGSGESAYGTTSGQTHNAKTNNVYLVPQSVKDEQRATHFKLGFNPAIGKKENQARPQTASVKISTQSKMNMYETWKDNKKTDVANNSPAKMNFYKIQDKTSERFAPSSSYGTSGVAEAVAKNRASNAVFKGVVQKPTYSKPVGVQRETSHQTAYRWVQPNKDKNF